jgi:K+ transporter
MDKRKINHFHNKYPFVESILIFILGIAIGILTNLFTDDITSAHADNWRVVDSGYLWIIIGLIAISVFYYWKFSSYSIGKQIKVTETEGRSMLKALTKKVNRTIKNSSPLKFEETLIIVQKSIPVLGEIGTKLIGGDSNDE